MSLPADTLGICPIPTAFEKRLHRSSMNHPRPSRRGFLIGTALLGMTVGIQRAGTAASLAPRAASDQFVTTPMQFGARGDGVTDDTAALNAMYAHVRASASRTVYLRGRRYYAKGNVYARDVSTIGEGATLISHVDSASSSCAFEWGGTDTFVTQLVFDLSNIGKETMQGILNVVNDAANQRFFANRVVARTTEPSKQQSNIFGPWFLGTGLDGLHVQDNQFEHCSYGVQVNNQDGMTRNVRTKPLGRPSQNLHVSGNTCIDATIGINTPHITCSNVVIEGNTITPRNFNLDLPINVAHVTELVIRGNTVTSNAASANGTLHVEDASGAVTISGNVVTALAANNGIEYGADPSVSHDLPSTTRAVITGNHVQGSVARGETVGILLPDAGTVDTTITGNYVDGFAQGITVVAASTVFGNTITKCPDPLRLSKDSTGRQNVVR
jgi:hypothetical protein